MISRGEKKDLQLDNDGRLPAPGRKDVAAAGLSLCAIAQRFEESVSGGLCGKAAGR